MGATKNACIANVAVGNTVGTYSIGWCRFEQNTFAMWCLRIELDILACSSVYRSGPEPAHSCKRAHAVRSTSVSKARSTYLCFWISWKSYQLRKLCNVVFSQGQCIHRGLQSLAFCLISNCGRDAELRVKHKIVSVFFFRTQLSNRKSPESIVTNLTHICSDAFRLEPRRCTVTANPFSSHQHAWIPT